MAIALRRALSCEAVCGKESRCDGDVLRSRALVGNDDRIDGRGVFHFVQKDPDPPRCVPVTYQWLCQHTEPRPAQDGVLQPGPPTHTPTHRSQNASYVTRAARSQVE